MFFDCDMQGSVTEGVGDVDVPTMNVDDGAGMQRFMDLDDDGSDGGDVRSGG